MLAEDGLANQKLVLGILGRMGHNADVAGDGRQAVEKYAAKQYDLVLMDVQMPEMDGIAATRAIRSSALEQPVIIALTANAFESDRQTCLDAGMDDFLIKPISKAALISAMVVALDPGQEAVA